MNIVAILITALIPLVTGFFWYNPKVFGNVWMTAINLKVDDIDKSKMLRTMLLTYVFSILIAMALPLVVIHQIHIKSAFFDFLSQINDPATYEGSVFKSVMDLVGNGHRTFGHGMLHGILFGILIIFPLISINALYEQRGVKYVFINAGYWTINCALMGGLLSVIY